MTAAAPRCATEKSEKSGKSEKSDERQEGEAK